jgi:hypothetical protein
MLDRFKPIPDEEGTEMTEKIKLAEWFGPLLQTDPR